MILLTDVTKSYGPKENSVAALRGITLEIEDREFVGLSGPSGSGKTTLLNIIGLADTPSSGNYSLLDTRVDRLSESELTKMRAKNLGYLFQSFNLLPTLSACENVMLPLLILGSRESDAHTNALLALEKVNIGHRAQHLPHQLSGGEMQRVALARAIVHQPAVLVADEPTGNLDSKNGAEVLALLRQLNNLGSTIIMATHSSEALASCSRIVRLKDGVIVG